MLRFLWTHSNFQSDKLLNKKRILVGPRYNWNSMYKPIKESEPKVSSFNTSRLSFSSTGHSMLLFVKSFPGLSFKYFEKNSLYFIRNNEGNVKDNFYLFWLFETKIRHVGSIVICSLGDWKRDVVARCIVAGNSFSCLLSTFELWSAL